MNNSMKAFTMKFTTWRAYSIQAKGLFGLISGAFATLSAFAGTVQVSVVDRDGKPAQDAVVVLVHATARNVATSLPVMATIANEKMQFIPAVTVVARGAKVRFVNNDPWDHHVRGAPTASVFANTPEAYAAGRSAGGFELRLEGKSDGKPAKFQEVTMNQVGAQTAVGLGCFLHGSMRGSVYVSDSPWAAKTNAEGMASFENVPDGAVQVRVWHADQLVDLPLQTITVFPAPLQVKSQLQITPRRRRSEPATSYSG
jgi:plastocyanin